MWLVSEIPSSQAFRKTRIFCEWPIEAGVPSALVQTTIDSILIVSNRGLYFSHLVTVTTVEGLDSLLGS
ncbi:hypothetical protein QII77_gp3 [ssRNA phage Zoerhiza.2_8]|uniref:Uncharacterized protein n=1 Tax=ssRNA phage Zoerhiza.2_8 TaxID=2786816 RepID=A0A8S5L2V8_9VIRU|nr:hypothetical protein QII77_gp3 [ssRNA phage Zoerhiza.2_8]DAD52001.1 TPA_asm: hypothetical protein [ssRNA phage Zoerhiza.2_8]